MRQKYRSLIILFTIILFIFLSDSIRQSILSSLSLCVKIMLPALFPFFILSGMLVDFGLDMLLPPTWCSFFIGTICGYPLGTRTVCAYYKQNKLKKTQASRLLACTANASPAFVVVAIGAAILQSKKIGFLLLFCQFINSFILFCLLIPKGNSSLCSSYTEISFVPSLINNTKNATQQILFTCSLTIVFGIICDLVSPLIANETINKLLVGFIEILHGCALLGTHDILIIAAVLGCSGLCVWFQCIYFIRSTDLSIKYLIFGKIHATFCLPLLISLFLEIETKYKFFSLIIIILTNTIIKCIIEHKGCEINHDFFKRDRKVLRLLRKSDQNSL